MNEIYFVYTISINDKVIYVGKTKNFVKRISAHLSNSYIKTTSKFYYTVNFIPDLYKCIYYNISIFNYPKFSIEKHFTNNKDALIFEKELTIINKNTVICFGFNNTFDIKICKLITIRRLKHLVNYFKYSNKNILDEYLKSLETSKTNS